MAATGLVPMHWKKVLHSKKINGDLYIVALIIIHISSCSLKLLISFICIFYAENEKHGSRRSV
jgi:hypothetical protein